MADKKYNFFESYHKALSVVPDEAYGRVVRAMSCYVFGGVEPQLTEPIDLVAWELIKPILEKGNKISRIRAASGKIGGINGKGKSRNAGNSYASKEQKQIISKTLTSQKQIKSGIGIGEGNIKETTSLDVAKKDDLSLRKNFFREKISNYEHLYDPDMLNDFFEYWTEPTPNGKKMRFELEKTWDVKRRLSRWYNNNKKR